MSGVSGSYIVSSRSSVSSSDDEIMVISESSSSKSLEEIGSVKELTRHQSRAGAPEGKGKERDVELGQPDPEEISSIPQSSGTEDDFDVLAEFGSNPKEWWFGREPLTQREVNLLTPTPAHQAVHQKARRCQVVWGVSGTLCAVIVPTYIGLAYYFTGFEETAISGPAAFGTSAALASVYAVFSLYRFLRAGGVVRPTESN